VLVTAALTAPAVGATWDEDLNGGGEAGEFPAASGFQTTTDPSSTNLTTITGSLGFSDGGIFMPNPDRDAYLITITDPSTFYATTSASVDATATNGDSLDTRLWLFNMDGDVVLGNEDTASDAVGIRHATVSDPSSFAALTGGGVDSTAMSLSADTYVLVIGAFNTDPEDFLGNDLAAINSGSFTDLYGPNPDAGPFEQWEPFATDTNGPYTIALQGAHVGVVPEPAAWGLVLTGVCAFAAVVRRRSVAT
jgi:hypothetical protein